MQVPHDNLTVGMTVWYRYSRSSIQGPFDVSQISRDHEGDWVMLERRREKRKVHLSDDEDFGMLLFYDADPSA